MKYKIWRSLDRPSSFFGIRGKFAYVLLGLAGIGAVFSFFVGGATNSLIGMIAFACCCVGAYMAVISLQGKMTDRTLSRFLASRRVPRYIHTRPRSIRSLLNNYNNGNATVSTSV